MQQFAKNGELKITVDDSSNNTSNNFSMIINENYGGPDYKASFNINDIKFLPGSYKVNLTNTIITKFEHNSGNIQYYIAVNKE